MSEDGVTATAILVPSVRVDEWHPCRIVQYFWALIYWPDGRLIGKAYAPTKRIVRADSGYVYRFNFFHGSAPLLTVLPGPTFSVVVMRTRFRLSSWCQRRGREDPLRPSSELAGTRRWIKELIERFHPTANPRIFGPVLHGTDTPLDPLSLLVEAPPAGVYLDGLEAEVEQRFRLPVALFTPGDLSPEELAEAEPL